MFSVYKGGGETNFGNFLAYVLCGQPQVTKNNLQTVKGFCRVVLQWRSQRHFCHEMKTGIYVGKTMYNTQNGNAFLAFAEIVTVQTDLGS